MKGVMMDAADVVSLIVGDTNVVSYLVGNLWARYDFYDRLAEIFHNDARAVVEGLRARARTLAPSAKAGPALNLFDVEMAIDQDLHLGSTPDETASTLLALADFIERHHRTISSYYDAKAGDVARRLGIL